MSIVSEVSPVVTLSQFDLYALPPVQTSVESTVQTEHRPLSALNSGGHIEFAIPTSVNEYIIPKEILLNVQLRIILSKTDKSEVVANDWNNVSIVNNFMNSLWRQVDFFIGDTQITTSLQTYSIKSYVETMIGFSNNCKKSFLSSAGWFYEELWDTPDTPVKARTKYIKHVTPAGLPPDKDKDVSTGRIYDLYGKLNLDIAFQGRAILGGSKLRVKLVPNPAEYFMMCSDEKIVPRAEFIEVSLNMSRARVTQDIVFAHHKALEITPARYPLTRSLVTTTTINAGTLNTSLENVINGQLPRRCLVFFVSNESFNGSFKKNPYYFHHYDLNFIACFQNSVQYPRRGFQPDFDNEIYAREYLEFYRALNEISTDCHMNISRSEWAKGKTIFGFNFSPDQSDGCGIDSHISPTNNGTMRIEVHFKRPLPETINVLIYSEFDNLIMIPEDRNAIQDFH